MKLHIGLLDILVICALVFAGILAHNYWNAHPTTEQQKFLTSYVETGGTEPTVGASQGGGGKAKAWVYKK